MREPSPKVEVVPMAMAPVTQATNSELSSASTLPQATPVACWPEATPAGALPEQPAPVFCSIINTGADTSTYTDNGWFDSFDHDLSFADFSGTSYRIFDALDVYQSVHWRHANHWMVDIASDSQSHADDNNAMGGAMLSPNRTFTFQNGKFVVDTDFAAGIADYEPGAWGEIIVSTGDHPVYHALDTNENARSDMFYGYEMFPNQWTVGCRLHFESHTICALMRDNERSSGDGGRVWEISFFQVEGDTVFGGYSDGTYFRFCKHGDPDMKCRDRFRLELTRTSLTIYANGTKYFEQTGLPALPDAFVNGNLHVYLASMVNQHPADTVRFHWDQLEVNSTAAPSAAPGFTPDEPSEPADPSDPIADNFLYLPMISQ
ncbi:MAG: hypothetical protein R3C14_41665 [Caldilineaceae bacterium]